MDLLRQSDLGLPLWARAFVFRNSCNDAVQRKGKRHRNAQSEKVWNGMSCEVSPEKSNLLAQKQRKQRKEEYRREGQRRKEMKKLQKNKRVKKSREGTDEHSREEKG